MVDNISENSENKHTIHSWIINNINEFVGIDQFSSEIVNKLGKSLNSDGCSIFLYDKRTGNFVFKSDYIADQCNKILLNKQILEEIIADQKENIINAEKIIIDNENGVHKSDTAKFNFRNSNIKSIILVPLHNNGSLTGLIAIYYQNIEKNCLIENINILVSISELIATVIKQINLYAEFEKQSERETGLNNIINIIRSSLDINEVYDIICEKVSKLFNVERVSITEFCSDNNRHERILRCEYRVDSSTKKFKKINFDNQYWNYLITNVFHNNFNIKLDNIPDSDTPGYFKKVYKESGIKSLMVVPIKSINETWGMIAISRSDSNHWTKNEETLLQTIADQIYISVKQAESFTTTRKHAEREAILRKIFETIRSSLDINETLTVICDEVAKLFNVQRATIVEFPDSQNYEEYRIRREYKQLPEIRGLDNSKYKKKAAAYWAIKTLEEGINLVIDNIPESDTPDYFKQSYEGLGVKSIFGFPIKRGKDIWGTFVLSEYNYYRHWTDDELNLLETVSDQIYSAIKQAELFTATKKYAEREVLLRKIVQTIRSSLDINETLTIICDEVAKLFNVQRASIVEFLNLQNYEEYRIRREYKSDPDVKGLDSTAYNSKTAAYWAKMTLEEGVNLVIDNIPESDTPDYFKQSYEGLGVKSIFGFPIKRGKDIWGTFVLSEYNYYRHWTDDELNLLDTISDQVYSAIKQAELFTATMKYANREALLRKIVEAIRSSLDINETLTIICDEVAKLFNVQRASIVEFLNPKNYEEYIIRREYKSIPEVKGLDNAVHQKKIAAYWATRILCKGTRLIVDNVADSDTPSYFKRTYQLLGVKSILGFPIKKGKDAWGTFVLSECNRIRHWTDDEISLLETITGHIYIAIKQAELYSTTIKQAEREHALYESVSVIRSTLNIDKIKKTFIFEAAKLFQADRSFIVEYDTSNNRILPVSKSIEYLASSDVKSITTLNIRYLSFWFKRIIIEKNEIIMLDGERYLQENHLESSLVAKFLKDLSIKSSVVIPIMHADKVYGVLVVQHTNKKVIYKNEDIEFIRTLASQVGIAFYQSQLYSSIETSNKYTKFILNGIKDGVIALNEEYFIESCNHEAGNIFDYPVSEITGKSISLLIPQLVIEKDKLIIKKENQRIIPPNSTDIELIGLNKSGLQFQLEVGINKIHFEKKIKYIFLVRDITVRKKVDQMKNEFISTVSHELRTPLTSIQGSLELILSKAFGELPDKLHNLVNITYKNSIRLNNLINDLLDMEKIEIGKMQFNLEILDIFHVINEAIESNRFYAEKFNVKLKFEDNGCIVRVNVDKDRLIQVITNLISNAAKFSPPNDIITISMQQIDNNVRIAVTDHGPGIPKEFNNRIFQKFSQADSSDTRQKGGTGLGLSISKAIIEKMNGNISFISELNKETTFYFDLPIVIN